MPKKLTGHSTCIEWCLIALSFPCELWVYLEKKTQLLFHCIVWAQQLKLFYEELTPKSTGWMDWESPTEAPAMF